MATRDRVLGLGGRDVNLTFQYDDITGLVIGATLVNNSQDTVKLTLNAADGTQLARATTAAPSQTISVPVVALRQWLVDTTGPASVNISMSRR